MTQETEAPLCLQCSKCPWLVSTNPHDIPNGYCEIKHQALRETIAEPVDLRPGPLRIMACHESIPGHEFPCVGWLHNQIGRGNNIALRMAVIAGQINGHYELAGEQHERFEDTLP